MSIPFKNAISQWENVCDEQMIGYSALTRKACIDPTSIFVIRCVNNGKCVFKSFDVGLEKCKGRWVVNVEKFRNAICEKIKAECDVRDTNMQSHEGINFPTWI